MTVFFTIGMWLNLVMCPAQLKAASQAKPGLFRLGQAEPQLLAQQQLWPGPT